MSDTTQQVSTAAILVTAAAAALGPVVGPYVVIAIGGVWGGVLSLTTAESMTRRQGVLILLRSFIASVGFTSLVSWAIAKATPAGWGATPETMLFAVAVFIGWSADRLKGWRDRLIAKFAPEQPKP